MLEFFISYAWFIAPWIVISTLIAWGIKFFKFTTPEKRWKKIFKWLLAAVLKAEELLGPGTGS